MNFLRKILLIAVVAVFTGNTEGMNVANGMITALPPAVAQMIVPNHNQIQLDFNSIANNGANVPASYQPKIYRNPTIRAPDKACVYFTVISNGIPNNANVQFQNAAIANPVPAREVNVYFPIDGSQPTTPEAVEYSCANVQDDSITEWYMQMFGVRPFQNTGNPANDYIKAGWDNNVVPNAQRIISFDASVDGTLVNDPNIPGATISRRALFEREFRKIAANPVGRVLLYRILIEIRRHNGRGEPVLENIPEIVPLLQITNYLGVPEISHCRNNGRRLLIIWNAYNFCYKKINLNHEDTNTLEYNSNKIMEQVAMGQVSIKRQTGILIEQVASDLSSDILHELLHWFHNLRDPLRSSFEIRGMNSVGKVVKLNDASSLSGYFYAGNGSTTEIQVSSLPWLQTDGNKLVINLEEMRTILGAPNKEIFTKCTENYYYLEGDDISENVFRLSQDFLMRLGHKESKYIASNDTFIAAATLSTLTHNTINISKKGFNIAKVDRVDLTQYPLVGKNYSFFTNMGNVATIEDNVVRLVYKFSF